MEHTKELLSVPLASLVPSRFNVRCHSVGQVEELAALIEAQSLLHKLVVTEQEVGRGEPRKMKCPVAAGEPWRRALLLLQQRGRWPKEHEVLCELVPPERALEVSLAENSGREARHPADDFEAFKELIDEGKGVEDVAVSFSVSVLTVQRRLKLSALSPKLMSLHRKDGINLGQLMALTLSDDHAVQERTWFEAQPWDRTPAAVRRRVTVGEVEAASSRLVRFVGIQAYEAAGVVVWLGWLIGLSQVELIDLLALCGALTVNALPGAGAAGNANAIAAALGLDMAMVWTPHLFPSWRRCAKLAVLDQPPT